VFFWFIGTAVVSVGLVFRDPRFDYRLLIVGSVLPTADVFLGAQRPLHSVIISVALLTVLMLVTVGRKPIRKTLLGLPIGMILHLVFDGAWNDAERFWWPLFGLTPDTAPSQVIYQHWWSLLLEMIGIAICVWLWRRNGLSDRATRSAFVHTGHLDAVPDRLG
jgi:hypothetical protein